MKLEHVIIFDTLHMHILLLKIADILCGKN